MARKGGMQWRAAVLLLCGAPASVAGQCLTITPGAKGNSCSALSSCTDSAPFSLGDCKTVVPGMMFCNDFANYGQECNACTCQSGCEGDGGSGTPQDWRPGIRSYDLTQSSANGQHALSARQQNAVVAQHNFVRAYHGACPLQWSDAIAENVAATQMSEWSSCSLVHSSSDRASTSPGGFTSLGENLASRQTSYYASDTPVEMPTMAWYLEEYDWDHTTSARKAGVTRATGHFTAMVWKDSTHIGCQLWQCDYDFGKSVVLACQYGPAGNYGGQYAEKVGKRGETATGCTTCGGDSTTSPPTRRDSTSPPTDGSGSGTGSDGTGHLSGSGSGTGSDGTGHLSGSGSGTEQATSPPVPSPTVPLTTANVEATLGVLAWAGATVNSLSVTSTSTHPLLSLIGSGALVGVEVVINMANGATADQYTALVNRAVDLLLSSSIGDIGFAHTWMAGLGFMGYTRDASLQAKTVTLVIANVGPIPTIGNVGTVISSSGRATATLMMTALVALVV